MTEAAKESRDFLAKTWFQLRFALACLAVVTVGSAAMVAVLMPRLRRAIFFEMYRGHSTVTDIWDLLSSEVTRVNLVATGLVVLLTTVIAFAILASVHRSALRLARDIRAAQDGADPAGWAPIARPREFRHLQKLLAKGIHGHRARLQELDDLCVTILGLVGETRAAPPGRRDLRLLHVLCERLRSHARRVHVD